MQPGAAQPPEPFPTGGLVRARGSPDKSHLRGIGQGTLKTAYNIALSDWFNPPVIRGIRREEGRIRVDATDNVLVTRVQVTILDEAGGIVEKGEGTKSEGGLWEYATATEGKVLVEAWDLAGNVTSKDEG